MAKFENASIRLKTARIAAGFKSAKEFCDKYHIPSSTYSLHETGKRNLKPKIAEKYANLLGVDVAWLLTGTGAPYHNQLTEKEQPLSHDEFMTLLQYQGNEQIKKSLPYKNEFLNDVNPLLFCKIVMGMLEVLHELNFKLPVEAFAEKAVEIYKDICQSSAEQKDQLTMVGLSVTTFKRQIQQLMEHNPKKVANE